MNDERAKARVPRPEEVIGERLGQDLGPELAPQPLPCGAGAGTENPCKRPATVWMARSLNWAACDEHARVHDLAEDVNEAGLAVEIATNWRDIARAWHLEGLEHKAQNILEDLKQDLLRADAKMSLAVEIADAPRKGGENPTLTREQDEEVRRLIRRADAFTDAFTHIEDLSDEQIGDKQRRNILAALSEESERASQEAGRYKEELGFKD